MASNTYNLNTYKAIFLAKEPTLTIGDTGKTLDGTVDVSFSKDEILGTSDSTYFLRGDKTWTNILTRADHTVDIGFTVENTDTTNPLKVGYIIGASGNGGIFDYTHSAWKVQIAPDGTTTFIGSLDGNATTASYPLGFSSRSTSASWGDQTGSTVTAWNESDGGSIEFRKNNPSNGKLSVKVDGRFYIAEGSIPVGGLKTDGSYWGLTSPDGDDTVWVRTTTQGILPYQSGGIGSGHSWIGHSSWFFGSAFVDHVYSHTLDLAGATDNNMSSTTSNPGIVFSESDNRTQPVFLVYTDYDSYRGPAGLKILGGSNATPAWFEVEGQIYAAGAALTGDLDLYTSSSDSPDITWWYANKGKEQARIWMGSGSTTKWAPNYRCYNSSGTSLYSGTLVCGDGTGASGTWGISISGNAATVSRAVFGDSGNGTHDANSMTTNGFYYYSANGPTAAAYGSETSDAGMFVQAYNTNWVSQIAQDYRTGQLWARGKNNGTWASWKKVVMADDASTTLTNCNSVKHTGIWTCSGFTNRPGKVSNWGSLFNIRLYKDNNNYHRQLFFDCYATNRIWTRSDNGGTWTVWREVLTNATTFSVKANVTFTNGYGTYRDDRIAGNSKVIVGGNNTGSTGVVFSVETFTGGVGIHACKTYNGAGGSLSWSGTLNNIYIFVDNSDV